MTAKNKRSYTRASTLLPFEVRRIPPSEGENQVCRLGTGGIVIDDAPPPIEDERLNLWLNMINAKLDYLIRLSPSRKEEAVSVAIEPLNISGGGMSLATKENFTLGEILEIRIVIQAYPSKVLYLYGNIVRIEAVPDKSDIYILGIKFFGMSENVRDEILRFDFKKHRQQLITRKIDKALLFHGGGI
ncbi:MAG TPA: PilZ domain-containing protein [Spirochaetia bacterium]|nr:PilZ domain-containing protein [Spirochaetia bacterium]